MSYYLSKMLPVAFHEAVIRTTDALTKEGFGIITEIDIKETLKKKIGVDFPSYRIFGACNPALAYEALKLEDKVGTMLPCNVVVRDAGDAQTEVDESGGPRGRGDQTEPAHSALKGGELHQSLSLFGAPTFS